jgi:hypothetical protein
MTQRASVFSSAVASIGALAFASTAAAIEPTAQAIEYYNARLDHYFMTAFPEEAAMLDAGILVKGWSRTGVTFNVWRDAPDDPGAVPVCRFFGTPGVVPTRTSTRRMRPSARSSRPIRTGRTRPSRSTCRFRQPADAAPARRRCTGASMRALQVSESNHRFLPDLTMHQKMASSSTLEGVVMCAPLSTSQKQADAVRLLEQSTFGANDALVAHVMAVGVDAFLDEQLAASGSRYSSSKYVPAGAAAVYCPTDPNPNCFRDYYTLFQLQTDFFRNALVNADQLRQRVAFALSQIFVTSGLDINEAYGMAAYQQIFLDNAFGNYETLMTRVSLSSVMGDYLNMVNNDKPVPGTNPNENYARELLQLFSIGLWELNMDGTLLLDASGHPIPAYDQSTVEGFAHVFTGWTYPVLAGQLPRTHNPKNFLGDMAAVAGNHDTGAKQLLDDALRRQALQWMPTWPARSATCSSIRTSHRS